jgi:hypothetical protein
MQEKRKKMRDSKIAKALIAESARATHSDCSSRRICSKLQIRNDSLPSLPRYKNRSAMLAADLYLYEKRT